MKKLQKTTYFFSRTLDNEFNVKKESVIIFHQILRVALMFGSGICVILAGIIISPEFFANNNTNLLRLFSGAFALSIAVGLSATLYLLKHKYI